MSDVIEAVVLVFVIFLMGLALGVLVTLVIRRAKNGPRPLLGASHRAHGGTGAVSASQAAGTRRQPGRFARAVNIDRLPRSRRAAASRGLAAVLAEAVVETVVQVRHRPVLPTGLGHPGQDAPGQGRDVQ